MEVTLISTEEGVKIKFGDMHFRTQTVYRTKLLHIFYHSNKNIINNCAWKMCKLGLS